MERDHGQRQLEDQGQEHILPSAEVGQHALQLIDDYKGALSRTPEFAKKLQDSDLTEAERADIWNLDKAWDHLRMRTMLVDFEKGDYKYNIKYIRFHHGQVLDVFKESKKTEHNWSVESVSLSAQVHPELPQFGMGIISDLRAYQNRTGEVFANTPTAIERVKEFLISNFNDPITQAPAKK
jgi:hypothetical protein